MILKTIVSCQPNIQHNEFKKKLINHRIHIDHLGKLQLLFLPTSNVTNYILYFGSNYNIPTN